MTTHFRTRRAFPGVSGLRALGVLALSAAPLASAAWGAPAWKKLAPRGGGFSVLMPSAPKAERKVSKEQDGTQVVDQSYESENDSGSFNIYIQEHDAAVVRLINTAAVLEESLREGAKEVGTKNVKLKSVTLNGFVGREGTVPFSEGGVKGTVRMRAFWAGRRMYVQTAGYVAQGRGKTDADRFMASFKLLRPQPK